MSLKVTFDRPILSVTGLHEGLVYRRNASGETYAYKHHGRTAPPTANERKARQVFSKTQKQVSAILKNPEERARWLEQYNSLPPSERKKKTFRGYVVSVIYPIVKIELTE